MHGAGNDFVVLDLRDAPDPSPELCHALADRHTGVGCDLILGVDRPRAAPAVASYRIWTADGAPSQQCGNGARCIAAWALREGLARGPRFALESPSGIHAVEVLGPRTFRIAMGVPRFAPFPGQSAGLPAGLPDDRGCHEVELDGGSRVRFAAVSMGNPHAVIAVDDVESAPVARTGRALQESGRVPPTVNVGFAEVVARDRIRLRVFEYGAGETLACGSGACAAAAALMRQGRVERGVSVALPGGELRIDWPEPDAPILMTGPAAFVFEGEFHAC
jgi:diaminopimelate epimerase/O-ureido-serine racemase